MHAAITVQTLLAAERLSCFGEIPASLSVICRALGRPAIAGYRFDRALAHGTCRALEMRDSATTLNELRLRVTLAGVQARIGDAGYMAWELREVVRRVPASRLAR